MDSPSPLSTKEKVISVYAVVDPALKSALAHFAADRGVSPADLVRSILAGTLIDEGYLDPKELSRWDS